MVTFFDSGYNYNATAATISAPCRQMEKASKCRYRGPEIHIFPINVRQYSAEVKCRVVNRWKGQ